MAKAEIGVITEGAQRHSTAQPGLCGWRRGWRCEKTADSLSAEIKSEVFDFPDAGHARAAATGRGFMGRLYTARRLRSMTFIPKHSRVRVRDAGFSLIFQPPWSSRKRRIIVPRRGHWWAEHLTV